jgi:hypothetical protein
MTLPIPFFRSQSPPPQPPAIVRAVSQQGVQWDRPMFKAPPLELDPRVRLADDFNADAFEGDRLQR